MRISDLISDVCSSDLAIQDGPVAPRFDGIDPHQHAIGAKQLCAHLLDGLIRIGRPRNLNSNTAQRLDDAPKARAFDRGRLPERRLGRMKDRHSIAHARYVLLLRSTAAE